MTLVETTQGDAGQGIDASGASSVVTHRHTLVKGSVHGISAAGGSSVQVMRGKDVLGDGGHGAVAEGGSYLSLTELTKVLGSVSSGVSVDGSRLRMVRLDLVQGAGADGVTGASSDVQIARCASIVGVGRGASFTGDGPQSNSVEMLNCPNVQGSEGGLTFDSVRAVTRGVVATGPIALLLSSAHHESQSDTFNGDAEGSNSVLTIKESAIAGDVTWTDVMIFDLKGVHGSSLSMDGVGMAMIGTTLPANSAQGCGIVGAKAALGLSQLQGGGVILSGGDADVQGVGAALMANAGIPTPTVDFVTATTGNVDVNGVANVLITAPNVRVNGA